MIEMGGPDLTPQLAAMLGKTCRWCGERTADTLVPAIHEEHRDDRGGVVRRVDEPGTVACASCAADVAPPPTRPEAAPRQPRPGPRLQRTTREQEKRIVAMAKRGKRTRAIAERVGVSLATVVRIRRRNGVTPPPGEWVLFGQRCRRCYRWLPWKQRAAHEQACKGRS